VLACLDKVFFLGGFNEAARVHNAFWGRGGDVAAHRKRAAADACDRVSWIKRPWDKAHSRCVPFRSQGNGFCRRPERGQYQFAEDHVERLPELAADLVRRRVSVICTTNNVATLAVKKVSSEIPSVFVTGLDPVLMGLVSTINRPGGNATGVYLLARWSRSDWS